MLAYCLGFILATIAGVLFDILERNPWLLAGFGLIILIAQVMCLGVIVNNLGVDNAAYRFGIIMIVMLPLIRLTDLISKKYKKDN